MQVLIAIYSSPIFCFDAVKVINEGLRFYRDLTRTNRVLFSKQPLVSCHMWLLTENHSTVKVIRTKWNMFHMLIRQDEYKMDPRYKENLFKNTSYISKTVKYCPAISKVDSHALQYLIQLLIVFKWQSVRFYKVNMLVSTTLEFRQVYPIMQAIDILLS